MSGLFRKDIKSLCEMLDMEGGVERYQELLWWLYLIILLKVLFESAKRLNLKSSHHKKENFVTMYGNGY